MNNLDFVKRQNKTKSFVGKVTIIGNVMFIQTIYVKWVDKN